MGTPAQYAIVAHQKEKLNIAVGSSLQNAYAIGSYYKEVHEMAFCIDK